MRSRLSRKRSAKRGLVSVVREEVARLDATEPALRRFGLAVGGVFLAIATVVAWRNDWTLGATAFVIAGLGAPLVTLGLVAPRRLGGVHRMWMTFALALGFVMTKVILALVFFLVLTPTALILRAFGKRLLDPGPDAAMASYWKARPAPDPARERLERSF